MARIVVLDAGPLGLVALARGKHPADTCRAWIKSLETRGVVIAVPEIADYEVRRELLRIGATASLARLDAMKRGAFFLPIYSAAMSKAAEFWALLRRGGAPTAAPGDLDGDAILAAQTVLAARPGDIVTIATTNVGHLVRFPNVDARLWPTVIR